MTGFRMAGAVAAVALFFTNAALYAFTTDRLAWPPLAFAIPLLLLVTPCLPGLLLMEGRSVARRVSWWAAFAVGIAVLGFVMRPASPIMAEQVLRRGLAVAFLLAVTALLLDPRARSAAQVAVAASVVFGVGLNLYDAVRPMTFSAVLGRAAGLYINPNISAAALAAGALVSIDRIPARWRAAFFVGATVGILATLSRGVLLAWAVAGLILVMGGVVLFRGIVRILAVAAILSVVGLAWWQGGAGPPADVDPSLVTGRWNRVLPSLPNGIDLAAGDALRLEVAREAWRMFQERPIAGHGLGATIAWRLPESTHSTYLKGAAEEGVAGLFLLPWLVLALGRGPPRKRPAGVAYAAFLAVLGLFTHNLLEEWPLLVATALAAGAPDPPAGSDAHD